jgi:uncharacterized protein DUF6518
VNSASAWLVAPFVVGALMVTRRGAAFAGLTTCALQLVGYYITAHLRGFSAGGTIVVFWTACAVVGGPLFGVAGQLWRNTEPSLRGLGMAVLAGVFVAEGLYSYLHELRYYATAALWVGIGVALAVLSSRGRVVELRWLALTVPLGVSGEIALTAVLHRSF